MTTENTQLHRYTREQVADALDQMNEEIDRRPERWSITPEQRAVWAGYPAQARAHRYPWVFLDPNHPIADYMRSGRIGPSYKPTKPAAEEQICK